MDELMELCVWMLLGSYLAYHFQCSGLLKSTCKDCCWRGGKGFEGTFPPYPLPSYIHNTQAPAC